MQRWSLACSLSHICHKAEKTPALETGGVVWCALYIHVAHGDVETNY